MPSGELTGRAKSVSCGAFSGRRSTIVAIPTSIVLARLLTPYDFGVVATAMFFIQIAQRLSNWGSTLR